MNDCAKLVFKVNEHITPEFCSYTKNEMMAISQFCGLGLDAWMLGPKCLLIYGFLNTHTRDMNSAVALCDIIHLLYIQEGLAGVLGFDLFSGRLAPKIMHLISSHIIVVSNCWKPSVFFVDRWCLVLDESKEHRKDKIL